MTDEEILTLAQWGCLIEDHYSAPKRTSLPDGHRMGQGWSVERTLHRPGSPRDRSITERFENNRSVSPESPGSVLVSGRSVGEKIGQGPVRIITSVQHLHEFKDGDVLVTDKTDPDWEPVMKKASAIVTNRGGRTCHAAIVSRELGLPAVVGAESSTDLLEEGDVVTVSCAEGDTGFVYEGALPFDVEHISLKGLTQPNTRIMMNIGNPEEAFGLSCIPNNGVGLARIEFIISTYIKIHPLALLKYSELKSQSVKTEIDRLTPGYTDKAQFFVDKLAEGVGMIGGSVLSQRRHRAHE